MTRPSLPNNAMRGSGFSLIEIAIVMVIMSVFLAIVAVPIATQVTQKRVVETQRLLDFAQQALIGFASANGRLPCPATDGSTIGTTNSLGIEQFAAGGTAATGKCEFWAGYLPAVTLGLSPIDGEGFMVDAWGEKSNRIRYAVWGSDVVSINTVLYPFTKSGGIKSATTPTIADTNSSSYPYFLIICQSAPAGAMPTATSAAISPTPSNLCGAGSTKLSDKAPIVIYSLGANAPTGGTGTDEIVNAKTTANQTFAFVSHNYTSGPTNEFDDLVSWLSLNILLNSMQTAGRLP